MGEYDDIPLLDEVVLVRLEKDTSKELVPIVANMFIEETKARVPSMMSAWKTRDYSILESEAHSLKSGAGSFGLSRLQDLAADINEDARQADSNNLEKRIPLVEDLCAVSLQMLEDYLKKLG